MKTFDPFFLPEAEEHSAGIADQQSAEPNHQVGVCPVPQIEQILPFIDQCGLDFLVVHRTAI